MFARARASFCAPMKINSKHRTISLASLLIHRYDIFITSANRIRHKLRSLVSRGNSCAPRTVRSFRRNGDLRERELARKRESSYRSSRVDYRRAVEQRTVAGDRNRRRRVSRQNSRPPRSRMTGQRLRMSVAVGIVSRTVPMRPRSCCIIRRRAINVDADSGPAGGGRAIPGFTRAPDNNKRPKSFLITAGKAPYIHRDFG